jgi:hypothetical protein
VASILLGTCILIDTGIRTSHQMIATKTPEDCLHPALEVECIQTSNKVSSLLASSISIVPRQPVHGRRNLRITRTEDPQSRYAGATCSSIRALTFPDGGDARCMSQLYLLREFMGRVESRTAKKTRICEFFDLIVAVDTASCVQVLASAAIVDYPSTGYLLSYWVSSVWR